MNLLNVLDPAISQTLALTIAHFLWQGAVLAILAIFLLAVLRRRSAPKTPSRPGDSHYKQVS